MSIQCQLRLDGRFQSYAAFNLTSVSFRYLPDVEEGKLSNSVVEIDINKPMSEVIPQPPTLNSEP